MNTFSKFSDVQAVMKKASGLLPNIEQQYSDCLQQEQIPEGLLVDIKDYLANLRTGLDYLWNKIPNISGDYFPVANSKADFSAKTKNIYEQHTSVLESFQDYDTKSWIRCFNLFRNKNVHLTLVPQKRKETRQFTVKTVNASAIFRDCTFSTRPGVIAIGGVPMTFDPKTQFPIDAPGVDIERIVSVDFLFDGSSISPDFPSGVSALPFLKESLKKVQNIVSELEKNL